MEWHLIGSMNMDYNSLELAYLGDAVYEVYVRDFLLKSGVRKVNNLQKEAVKLVSARGQSSILDKLVENNFLKENELVIVKRARNAKTKSSPKNTDIITYKYATGFEALVGYLYLNDKERLDEIINIILGEVIC